MDLENNIRQWDGKSADDIRSVYESCCHESLFVSQLFTCMEKAPLQVGATWLLKKHFEEGAQLDKDRVKRVYCLLPKFVSWEAILHVLQCIPYMPVSAAQRAELESFLRDCLTHDNKFVRAWTYNGFYELARQYPELQQEAMQFFEMAMKDEAASVKARIRNVMKKGF